MSQNLKTSLGERIDCWGQSPGSSLEAGAPPHGKALPLRRGTHRAGPSADLACDFRKYSPPLSRQQPLRASDPAPKPPGEGKGVMGPSAPFGWKHLCRAPPVPESVHLLRTRPGPQCQHPAPLPAAPHSGQKDPGFILVSLSIGSSPSLYFH